MTLPAYLRKSSTLSNTTTRAPGLPPQLLKFFNNWGGKPGARVVVFDNVDDFRKYAGNVIPLTHAGLAGYCHFITDEAGNQFYELVTYENQNMWRVLAHEGFH